MNHHHDGSISFYHQALVAALISPNYKEVFPVAIELIVKPDGKSKNDGEIVAVKRLIAKIKDSHPHFKFRVVADGLYGNGPLITELQKEGLGYIITATPGKYSCSLNECQQSENEITKHYKWASDLPLNVVNSNMRVNLVEYSEFRSGKLRAHFSRAVP